MQQPRVQICLGHQEPLGDLLGSQETRGVRLEGVSHLVVEDRIELPPEERQQVEHEHAPFVARVKGSKTTRGNGQNGHFKGRCEGTS